mgnify:CR=1 FL=1
MSRKHWREPTILEDVPLLFDVSVMREESIPSSRSFLIPSFFVNFVTSNVCQELGILL